MDGLAGSEQSARSAVENAHEAYICMDAGGLITDWNPQAEVTFGWSRAEALGRVLAETIIPERFRDEHWAGLNRFVETGKARILNTRLELSALHREGYEFPVELTIAASTEPGGPAFYAFLHDISERRRSDQFLRAQHALSAALAQAQSVDYVLPEVLGSVAQAMQWDRAAYWRPEDDRLRCKLTWSSDGQHDGRFAQASRRTLLGVGEGLPGEAWQSGEPVWVADVSIDPTFVRKDAAAREGLHSAVALPVAAGDGTRGVLEFFSLEAKPRQAELVEMMSALSVQAGRFLDILEEREGLISRLELLATTDELTGVSNRRGWEESLSREIARSRREGGALYVALFDLDDFKSYNDEHGHQAGDDLLRQTATEWSSRLRATDILARYGGEEFALVFPTHPPETAVMVVERLRAAMPPGVSCSAGLACWNRVESAEELVGRADGALYEAKRAGRNRLMHG
jgi:diguanylate cyclase (GGDEF)-like protein/PAS domain S-box-containing protein